MQRWIHGLGRAALGLIVALGLGVLGGEACGAATVSTGVDASATLKGAVRYRNLSNSGMTNQNIRVGDGVSAGAPSNAVNGSVTWATGSQSVEFKLVLNALSTKAGASAAISKTLAVALAPVNYLELILVKATTTTSISLTNVKLNGSTLGSGSFTFGTGSSGTASWNVTGVDLYAGGGGFTLSGDLVLSTVSGFGGGDSAYVQVAIGSVPLADDEAPIVSDVDVDPKPVILNGDATVTANVDDSTTGGSNVASADYTLDGGTTWLPMSAADGSFDSVSEDVTATFTANEVGAHTVCVRGTDAEANTSAGTDCAYYAVTYEFAGFYPPIDNAPAVNVAKAGQAIPVKWRLTDALGTPIDDPASFAGLYAFQIACDTLIGNPGDAVEQYAPGGSGLQYNGDGYWQYNWRTERTYAGKCFALYVMFNSGLGSPNAYFSFTR